MADRFRCLHFKWDSYECIPIARKLIGTAERYPDEAAGRSRGNAHCDTQPRWGPRGIMRDELSPLSPTPTDLELHWSFFIVRRQSAAFGELFHVAEHLLEE